MLLLSGKNIFGRINSKMADFFKSKAFKQYALKIALQEPFKKEELKFCLKEASSKAITTYISFSNESFL